MLTEEQKQIVEEVISKVIYSIRRSDVLRLVYTYYISDFVQALERNKVRILYDFASFKLQCQRKILTQRNNYWNLDDSKVKFVEELALYHESDFDCYKKYIEDLFVGDLTEQTKMMEAKEEEKKSQEEERFQLILKDKFDTHYQVIKKIVKDDREYPCKSDKIKVLLELGLDNETIYNILAGYEKWIVQRGYIEKYRKERQDGIMSGAVRVEQADVAISRILSRLINVEV